MELTTSNWRTITKETPKMTANPYAPIYPGEILMEEYLVPIGISQHKLAVTIGVPPRRINEIVHGKRAARSLSTASRYVRTPFRPPGP
jgi:addiction module HigA family antidote